MYARIKALCDKRKITIAELERTLVMGNGVIRRWDTSSPSVDKVAKVAQYFGVSIDYLVFGDDNTPKRPAEEQQLIDDVLSCSDTTKAAIRMMIEATKAK